MCTFENYLNKIQVANIPRVLYGIRAGVMLLCVRHDTNGEYEMFEETVENNKSFTSMCTYTLY